MKLKESDPPQLNDFKPGQLIHVYGHVINGKYQQYLMNGVKPYEVVRVENDRVEFRHNQQISRANYKQCRKVIEV